jgi:hypothetical protein
MDHLKKHVREGAIHATWEDLGDGLAIRMPQDLFVTIAINAQIEVVVFKTNCRMEVFELGPA